jgi:pilus assembly protein Flp/PilA
MSECAVSGFRFLDDPPELNFFKKVTCNMLTRLWLLVPALKLNKRAVTAIEYALIAALIAVVIIAAIKLLGTNISTTFNKVSSEL